MNTFYRIAKALRKIFPINVLPLNGKRPIITWDKWQSELQTDDDVEKMNWNEATGIGVVQGIGDLRVLDFDGVEEFEIIKNFMDELGLPEDYPWLVQSGSGVGFHLYMRSNNEKPKSPHPNLHQRRTGSPEGIRLLGGEKAVYKFKPKDEDSCKHVELRWKDCQTALPPSNHESGGVYCFVYNDPMEAPVYVEWEKLIDCIEKFCLIEATTPALTHMVAGQREREKVQAQGQIQVHEQGQENGKIYYDRERLKSALDFLSQNLPEGCYDEWYRIGFALVPLGEEGENYFLEMSLKNPNYNDSEWKIKNKFAELKKDYDGRVTLGTLYHTAELYGWKKPFVKFWKVDDGGKVKIAKTSFKKFLESEGFCKFRMDTSYLFIREENNIIEEIDSVDVKEFVMNYLNNLPIEIFEETSRNEVSDALINLDSKIFTNKFLEFLITRKIDINKDTKEKGYFYFKNGFAEVSPDPEINSGQAPSLHQRWTDAPRGEGVSQGIKFYEYKKLQKNIWKKQIIRRSYSASIVRSVFEDFLFNICRSDLKRFTSLKSAIGYLLHNYKDPSLQRAIVFIDEKLSEGAFGRSGKGLVIKSIQQVRSVVIEDGRNFNPSKNFAFQRVKADTNILAFEDIREKFPFDRLFSIITDGITIERKNKDEIHLNYDESPKIVISTNFSIAGVDDSTIDRQFIIEFSDYYNKSHRPIDDFGKPFFSWNPDEWSSFDNFMISCLQLYLDRGLVPYEFVNIEKKKMIDETCPEFVEFVEEGIQQGIEYEKKELYEKFKAEYEDFQKLSQGKFTRWLKVWAKVKGYSIEEKKSGSKRVIVFDEVSKAA